MTVAGTPAAKLFGGTFFVTTAPAPMTEFSPLVTAEDGDGGGDPDIRFDDDLPFSERAQSLVNGFCNERPAGVGPRAARTISISARNATGTCRRPG